MHGGWHLASKERRQCSAAVMNGSEANEKGIMGRRVHTALISPGETGGRRRFCRRGHRVKRVRAHTKTTAIFFPSFSIRSTNTGRRDVELVGEQRLIPNNTLLILRFLGGRGGGLLLV